MIMKGLNFHTRGSAFQQALIEMQPLLLATLYK